MGRGRKPATLKLHPAVLAGSAPPPKPEFVVGCPIASAEWDRIVGLMLDKATLTPADAAALGAYCSAFSTVARCRAELQGAPLATYNEKSGATKPHALLGVLSGAERSLMAFASELGLTPAARSRLPAAPPKLQDDLSAFLAKG